MVDAAPTSDEFRRAMAHLPTGVTVVSALAPGGPLGATANAVSSLSLEPPLMLAALDGASRTLAAVREARRFGVNVLGGGHEDLARGFATKAPHDEKWANVAWSERAGVPIIDGVPLWVACELRDAVEAGDHVALVGSVVGLGQEGGEALVFHRGAYRRA